MSSTPQSAASICPSCGKPLAGRFCSNCGEERLDFHNLTIRHFLIHSFKEIFELDGKIWRTLRALLSRPAFLAIEYSAGRRRPYINPFRLLITAAIVYALCTHGGNQVALSVGPVVVSLAPTTVRESTSIVETVKSVDRFHLLSGLLATREGRGQPESELVRQMFHQRLEKFAEPLSFANVFMLALALAALFSRRRNHFVEHGVFSMHFMSFVLFTGSLIALLPLSFFYARGWGSVFLACTLLPIVLWQFIYLVLAIRRFYFGSHLHGIWPRLAAGFGVVAIYFLNSVFITGVQTLGAALALWMISPTA